MSYGDDLPRKPGRKPGTEKTGGRQKGVPNKITKDVRETILKRGKPLELLADICRGRKVRIGPQGGPGEPEYRYPTFNERMRAAETLLPYIAPKMANLQVTGEDGGPIEHEHTHTDATPRQLASAVLSLLREAHEPSAEDIEGMEFSSAMPERPKPHPHGEQSGADGGERSGEPSSAPHPPQDIEQPPDEPEPRVREVGEREIVGDLGHFIEASAVMADKRCRFWVCDPDGQRVVSAIGEDQAKARAWELINNGTVAIGARG